MSQTNETKEQQEMKNGSPLIRTTMVTSPFPAPGTPGTAGTPGMLYPGINIIQHIYPPTSAPDTASAFLKNFEGKQIMEIIDELIQLSPEGQEKVFSRVKESSETASRSGKISDLFQAVVNLPYDKWLEILEEVYCDDEPETEDTPWDKLTVMITGTRDLSDKDFEKLKSRVMGHPAFKDGDAGRNLLDALYQVRAMTVGDFELLSVMVKLPSDKIPAIAKPDLKKTCIQLRQLTIEQADVVLGMVKDSSIT